MQTCFVWFALWKGERGGKDFCAMRSTDVLIIGTDSHGGEAPP